MAVAVRSGSSALKMPEPTNTPSAPSCIISAASAGVAMPPAEKLTTGRPPFSATMRTIRADIARLSGLPAEELFTAAKELGAPYELVAEVARAGRLPVVLFTAGGIATPADAALMMQLGAEGVFVGSGIFKSGNPAQRAEAIVKATTFFDDPDVLAKVSRGLGEAMVGINVDTLSADQRLASRGW